MLRYWDGQQWTDHRAPKHASEPAPTATVPVPPAPPGGSVESTSTTTPTTRPPFGPAGIVALIAAAVAIVGSFGPWATTSVGPFSVTTNGMDGDGIITLVGAGAALVLIVFRKYIASAVLAAIAGVVGVIDLIDLSRIADEGFDDVSVTAGWGIWMVVIGGLGCFVASLVAWKTSKSAAPTG